ncbi:hypothetical protein AC579_7462 [Pseudocercospora musae]|uniref:Uncharacterized protein n=1 Tax=Pseudocercospora musae TaxID=113226 RepID=A0A139H7P2_9PEZI|nr:hypothetical protein AC579_7462 [Pseudocercospora musae]
MLPTTANTKALKIKEAREHEPTSDTRRLLLGVMDEDTRGPFCSRYNSIDRYIKIRDFYFRVCGDTEATEREKELMQNALDALRLRHNDLAKHGYSIAPLLMGDDIPLIRSPSRSATPPAPSQSSLGKAPA